MDKRLYLISSKSNILRKRITSKREKNNVRQQRERSHIKDS